MKVLVCFKAVPDLTTLSERDWVVDERCTVETRGITLGFNCFDESALEMALRLSLGTTASPDDANSLPACLTALTVDSAAADLFLRKLYAVGYDKAVRVEPPPSTSLAFNAALVAQIIVAYVKTVQQQDLLFFGKQDGLGDNAETGFLVAECLRWPCIRDVVDVSKAADGRLVVTSRLRDGTLVQTLPLPVVLVVGTSVEAPRLRVPTLQQRLHASNKAIELLSCSKLGIDVEGLLHGGNKRFVGLRRVISHREAAMIEGDNPRDIAQQLYDTYLRRGLGRP